MGDNFDDTWKPPDVDEDWYVVRWRPENSGELATAQDLEKLCEELIRKLHFRARADVCLLFHNIYVTASEAGSATVQGIREILGWSTEDLSRYCNQVCDQADDRNVTF